MLCCFCAVQGDQHRYCAISGVCVRSCVCVCSKSTSQSHDIFVYWTIERLNDERTSDSASIARCLLNRSVLSVMFSAFQLLHLYARVCVHLIYWAESGSSTRIIELIPAHYNKKMIVRREVDTVMPSIRTI